MFILSKLYILCALCTFATAAIFSWEHFNAFEGEPETKLNFKGLNIDLYRENAVAITYLAGEIVITTVLNKSIEVSYLLQELQVNGQGGDRVVYELKDDTDMCDYLSGFYEDNLLPAWDKRSNFPPESYCHIDPGTYPVSKATSIKDLDSDSILLFGYYLVTVKFFENKSLIGGFNGTFVCER